MVGRNAISAFNLPEKKMEPDWKFYQGFEQIIEMTPLPSIGEPTRANLNNLTELEIHEIKEYFRATFPKEFSQNNFACLTIVRELIHRILSQLQDGDTILVPGDSPYKLVEVINLILDLPQITFISFPLSGLGYMYDEEEVKEYLTGILRKNGIVSPKQLKILDYSWSGAGYQVMVDLLREIFNRPDLKIPLINTRIDHDNLCHSLIDELFANAEHLRSRCVTGYFLEEGIQLDPVDYISQVRCDVVIIILVLYLQGRLN